LLLLLFIIGRAWHVLMHLLSFLLVPWRPSCSCCCSLQLHPRFLWHSITTDTTTITITSALGNAVTSPYNINFK
jgi:hypothetical protein